MTEEEFDETFGALVEAWRKATSPERKQKLERFMARLAYWGPEGVESHGR